jgi:tRNA A37 methylthiotransferase MiaB
MMSNLKDFEVTQEETEADVVIINSCTVTNSADSTARGYISALKITYQVQAILQQKHHSHAQALCH